MLRSTPRRSRESSPGPRLTPYPRGIFCDDHIRKIAIANTMRGAIVQIQNTSAGTPRTMRGAIPRQQNLRFASNADMHVDYSTIYIPSGPGHPWAGPEEWGPLMVFLAAALLWPDLPFLVCHPRFLLGAHAPLDELSEVFKTTPHGAFLLCQRDVLYHPGQTSKFALHPPFSCTDPPFRQHTPDYVQQLVTPFCQHPCRGCPIQPRTT